MATGITAHYLWFMPGMLRLINFSIIVRVAVWVARFLRMSDVVPPESDVAMKSAINATVERTCRPLRKDHALSLLDNACLRLRAPRYATCKACENVCPVGAIHVDGAAIRMDESCVGCGRCAAACPMGALALPGFSVPTVPHENVRKLHIDCWKVPAKLSPPGTARVPCLGGLSPGRILEWMASAGLDTLELLNRGWCSRCRAGGSQQHPAQASLDQARALLDAAGCHVSRLPRLSSMYLPIELLPIEMPAAISETKISRRRFFSALSVSATATLDQVSPLASEPDPPPRRGNESEPVASHERERLLRNIRKINRSAKVATPPGLFHRIAVSAACNNHQLCARICPTGALAVYSTPDQTGLNFASDLCIGCNECRSICPSGALRVLPNGYTERDDVLPDRPVHLTSFRQKCCSACGKSFADKSAKDQCRECEKQLRLASSAFQTLFGSTR